MKSKRKMKQSIKKAFYEEGGPPSNMNYLLVLAVIIIIAIVAIFIVSQIQVEPTLPTINGTGIASSADIEEAVSNMGDMLSDASNTLDELDERI